MPTSDRLKLTLPNDLAYLPIAQMFVRETARQYGFRDEDLTKIEIAVEESVSNVIEHGFEPGERGAFDIICERMPVGIRIVIKEQGIPFDPSRLPVFHPGEDLTAGSGSGLGLYLMRKLMDEVSFRNLGPEGKEMQLVKYLPASSIDQLCSKEELQPVAEPAPAPVEAGAIEYDVRALAPAEAIEVSRCAYKSHGYTFFDDHIYYPDRLLQLQESGKMLSAVAVTKDGTFMGHAALVRPKVGARIAELTYVFVNVQYRSQGCMKRLCEYLFTAPTEPPLSGVYAYAVTNHVFTQKVMEKYGINDCGLELATSPATWVFKGIASPGDGGAQRMSVVLSFRYLTPPEPLTLYPPAQHAEMIERLYRNIGAEAHRFAMPAAMPELPQEASTIDVDVHASEQNGEIMIGRYGANAVREVRSLLRALCLRQIAAVNLLLNLEDPATYFLTAEFERMGFFFSGVLPKSAIGDALVLQYLNNVELDYDKILVHTAMGREILAYIKARDPNLME